MKKSFLFLMLSLGSLTTLPAQDSFIKNRWNIKIGCSPQLMGLKIRPNDVMLTSGNLQIEATYNLSKFFGAGLYLGYDWYPAFESPGADFRNTYAHVPGLGLGWNLHLLPFVFKRPELPIDLYLLGKYGCNYVFSPEGFVPPRGIYFACSHGVGLSAYFNKHFGFFVEESFSKLNVGHWYFRGGLAFRF